MAAATAHCFTIGTNSSVATLIIATKSVLQERFRRATVGTRILNKPFLIVRQTISDFTSGTPSMGRSYLKSYSRPLQEVPAFNSCSLRCCLNRCCLNYCLL